LPPDSRIEEVDSARFLAPTSRRSICVIIFRADVHAAFAAPQQMKISRQDAKVAKLFFASFFLCGLAALREIKDFQGRQ